MSISIPNSICIYLSKISRDIYLSHVCITLCDSRVQPHTTPYSPPGSSAHGILQARILEWVTIPFSRGSSQPRDQTWIYIVLCVVCLVSQSNPTLCNPMDCSPPGSSVHGNSLGKNTGVGCHALIQGLFLTQGSNSGLPHCRWVLYHLSHQGSPVTYITLHLRFAPKNTMYATR